MKRIYKILAGLAIIGILAGAGMYWYAFMRPHTNMLKAEAEVKLSASDLFNDFSSNEAAANTKYIGKIIEVTGNIVQVNTDETQTSIILEDELFGVSTYLDSSFVASNPNLIQEINPNQSVTIRGQCDGMLSDVVISRAVIIQ